MSKSASKPASKPPAHTRTSKPGPATQLTVRLHALLHTVRSIAQAEDELCTLLHEVERTDTLTPNAYTELHALLNKMPAHEYAEDLEAVRSSLSTQAHKTVVRKKPVRKPIKAKAATKPKVRKAKS